MEERKKDSGHEGSSAAATAEYPNNRTGQGLHLLKSLCLLTSASSY